eukprot:TRINITY_DN5287_c0_g1_i3.p1 TRINITY_DN5287_c0_g1~~TRINITY_DN5287_c0_g1_i3.p1  ORF type:complete len:151 (-),score=33.65 TRINITY_DN5287_c0_g1_i3:169-621(-)
MIELLTSTAFAAVLLVPCLGEKLGYGACEEELLDVFSAVESRDKCGDFCDSTPGCGFYSYCPKGGKGSKGSCDTMGLMSSKAGWKMQAFPGEVEGEWLRDISQVRSGKQGHVQRRRQDISSCCDRRSSLISGFRGGGRSRPEVVAKISVI